MKTINLTDLYNYNYSLDVLNALKQYWDTRDFYHCIGTPKDKNMLLYLDDLEAEYTLKDGKKIYASYGDLVYLPIGSEYHTKFYNKKSKNANTIGINFFLYDENLCSFNFSNSIMVFKSTDCGHFVRKANMASELAIPCYGEMKAAVYDIVSLLSKNQKRKSLHKFHVIEKGISHIDENLAQNLSVKELSQMCNISEIYFRRLFKEYSGLSPVSYIIKRKIEKAKSYLEYDDLNVTEIADSLGFTDTAYFCKQFKLHTGTTPLKYKYGIQNHSNT
ncbi:MAG: helix-turn-helix transcriptional regulator [Ruminococcaceae bacterium]|nr:helix-turn-helix transcriptional regulator [Oscillospiraceae bacterium]